MESTKLCPTQRIAVVFQCLCSHPDVGLTTHQIGKATGVAPATVRKILETGSRVVPLYDVKEGRGPARWYLLPAQNW